jgi:hypothetical protein
MRKIGKTTVFFRGGVGAHTEPGLGRVGEGLRVDALGSEGCDRRVVGVAGGQDDPRVVGEVRLQETGQQVVGEVMHAEGGLEAVGRAPVQVP